MFIHGRCCEKNPTAKLYHKTRLEKLQSIALPPSENRVLEAYGLKQTSTGFFQVWKHLLETINQVPSGTWYNISVRSYSSSLILRLSFCSLLFWKWYYTGSAAAWLLESQYMLQ